MAKFVKLDCGILDSTLWVDKDARDVFITALLMAEPWETTTSVPQICVDNLEPSGWSAPPGWYGFVPAAGSGIVRRALVDMESGMLALKRLGEADPDSRTAKFDGRRLIRVNGGYLVLNFIAYRDRDYSGAERARRYRLRKKAEKLAENEDPVTGDDRDVTRNVTQGEGRGERGEGGIGERVVGGVEGNNIPTPSTSKNLPVKRDQHAVNKFIQSLSESSWARGRARKEAWVTFGFFQWRNGIKQRVLFHKQREARTINLIEAYGLVRVLLAIEGQRTHPDFNDVHGKNFRGYDNLFRAGKGFENIEKCSAEAIEHGRYEWTLKQLVGLGEKRGWTPGPLDVELFNQIRGTQDE